MRVFQLWLVCLLPVVLLAFVSCGGGGGTVVPDPVVETPDIQQQTTSATGEILFASAATDIEVTARVSNGEGEAVDGVQVSMIAGSNAVILQSHDPTGTYLPQVKVIPHGHAASSLRTTSCLRIDAYLVLSETGEGVAGVSFNSDPPVLNINWVEPGKVTVMGDVNIAAQQVIPMGGVITIKTQLTDGSWKLINLHFGKDWTLDDVVAELANFLDINRDYNVSTHESFPRYAEIEAGKSGDLYDAANGITWELLANGDTATGHVGDVTVTNNSEFEYRLIIVPGTTFENSNTDHQDLTVIRTTVVLVAPGETATGEIWAACVHKGRAGPQAADSFTPFLDQRWDLVKICILIDQTDIDLGIGQDAIWVITDDSPPKARNRDAVIEMFLAVGLNPEDYEGLREHDQGGGGSSSVSAVHPDKY